MHLKLGFPEIDAQHEGIYQQICALVDEILEPKGKKQFHVLVTKLRGSMKEHFAYEEAVLRSRVDIESLEKHREEHEAAISDLGAKSRALEILVDSGTLIESLAFIHTQSIINWFFKHIVTLDKQHFSEIGLYDDVSNRSTRYELEGAVVIENNSEGKCSGSVVNVSATGALLKHDGGEKLFRAGDWGSIGWSSPIHSDMTPCKIIRCDEEFISLEFKDPQALLLEDLIRNSV
ncbi:hemerythrin domain-containing protein [Magnetofaba australis]|nr:hemerythrin domain-containing protein [Magnetofaba australis]